MLAPLPVVHHHEQQQQQVLSIHESEALDTVCIDKHCLTDNGNYSSALAALFAVLPLLMILGCALFCFCFKKSTSRGSQTEENEGTLCEVILCQCSCSEANSKTDDQDQDGKGKCRRSQVVPCDITGLVNCTHCRCLTSSVQSIASAHSVDSSEAFDIVVVAPSSTCEQFDLKTSSSASPLLPSEAEQQQEQQFCMTNLCLGEYDGVGLQVEEQSAFGSTLGFQKSKRAFRPTLSVIGEQTEDESSKDSDSLNWNKSSDEEDRMPFSLSLSKKLSGPMHDLSCI